MRPGIWRKSDLYIARDNPAAAARIASRIRQAVDRLEDHPNLGRPGRERGTRELVVARTRYLVAYSVAANW